MTQRIMFTNKKYNRINTELLIEIIKIFYKNKGLRDVIRKKYYFYID